MQGREGMAGSQVRAGTRAPWQARCRPASPPVLPAAPSLRALQRQADAFLHHWVLGRHTAPEQHGEL